MFALYEWFMLPMTITCRPSRSFFLFIFCFIHFFCLQKNYTFIATYEKSFSLYTYIPLHDELFLYTHALKLFLFISTRSIYKLYSCSKISFSFFSTYTRGLYKDFFIYTRCSHKRIYLHTHKIFPYIFFKTLFFSLYIDTTFVRNTSFFFLFLALSWFCSFYF